MITGSWDQAGAHAACIAAGYDSLAFVDSATDVTSLSYEEIDGAWLRN